MCGCDCVSECGSVCVAALIDSIAMCMCVCVGGCGCDCVRSVLV